MGVATGCGFKEIYRFPHTTYPYSSCICTFCSSIPTFCSFKKMFFVLYIYIYTNKSKEEFVCLFACLSGMAGHVLYGMAPCFGHTGVTFDAENDRPGPSSL